ncbi:hypothetical protein Ciccas_004608 [Cichlidogyrus casuarinus]|uniref:Nipped-B protein n=1 Tax=Cichlidogyrus casuarinus TaxID=1844966 RepID=A0ABD2QB35_9PLAT
MHYYESCSCNKNQSSIKSRRARQKEVQKSRNVMQLYHRLVECVAGLGELVEMQRLTDGIVLSLSSMGVSIFFVENICELQLAALKLVTGLFSLYVPHRKLIIEDILASLARLPSSKRNLRSYRLNTEDSIQMLTALALLLVQSVIVLHDEEMSVISSYQDAMRTAHMFLSAFLKKSTLKGEDDYRMIFENFVNDLLLTVNKPEWPAAEVMLSLLGSLLVQQFNNKNLDQPTRVASVDYLGTVASTLRRDAVNSQLRERDIDNILRQLLQGDGDEEEGEESRELRSQCHAALGCLDRVQALRDALVDYLFAEQEDPTAIYARRFYLGQWLSDCTKEGEKKSEQEALDLAERRRAYLLEKAAERYDQWRSKRRNRWNSPPDLFGVVFRGQLDYEEACMVCRYLASMRPFSQSFDIYLSQICKLLSETSVPVRTKALRCLSAVVEADPDVLARKDIQSAVHSRLLDSSTSVREAAVDLLGRFLLCRPELTNRYYPMLAERILDKGVSVRKRVIRILRDVCLEQPDFPRIPEICIKMIRRVNDEEGIKKLVNEVFQMMWFTPVRERDSVRLIRKVMNITEVVAACRKTGYDWFEQFLCNLLKKEECEKVRPVERACKQIVESLVETVMRLEEVTIPSSTEGGRLLACIATLHLFTKIRPELMVQNTLMLQPYLAIKCQNANDVHIVHHVARILEVSFLAQ